MWAECLIALLKVLKWAFLLPKWPSIPIFSLPWVRRQKPSVPARVASSFTVALFLVHFKSAAKHDECPEPEPQWAGDVTQAFLRLSRGQIYKGRERGQRKVFLSLWQTLTLTSYLVTALLSLSLTMAGNQLLATRAGMLMAGCVGWLCRARRPTTNCS